MALEADLAAGQRGEQDDHAHHAAADHEDTGAEAQLGEDDADLLAVLADRERDVADDLPPEQQLLAGLLEHGERVAALPLRPAAGDDLAHIAPPVAAVISWEIAKLAANSRMKFIDDGVGHGVADAGGALGDVMPLWAATTVQITPNTAALISDSRRSEGRARVPTEAR